MMSVKGTDYKHDRSRSMTGIALSYMLFTVIFGLSTRWHQDNKLGFNIRSKDMLHTTGFTATIIHRVGESDYLFLFTQLEQAKVFTIF